MIILRDISLRRGNKLLFRAGQATLQPGQRIALIGANGSGKSSLLQMLLGQLEPDSGSIEGLDALRIGHMAQEVSATDVSALDYVLQGDAELARLHAQLTDAEAQENYTRSAAIHTQLEAIDGYSGPRRAQRMLNGLGFAEGDGERAVKDFSGGWRIRLNLARALMSRADMLLLDEPTNHLDLDATLWLQQWLRSFRGTLIIISHDRDFIDASCERILHIEQQQLISYRGNYSDFERLRAERLANEQANWEKQQRRVSEIEAFVARFRYKATKAKQAQSRLKELDRMQQLSPAYANSPFDFAFLPPPASSDPLLRLDEAALGYTEGAAIIRDAELHLRPGSRLGLLGRNGAGKSTLLKTLAGDIPLLEGERTVGANCQLGYFNQQQLEALDLQASAATHLQRLRPDAREQDVLNFLGGFNFNGDAATSLIAPFSGGEKARLALAMIVWQKPNLLILDEPTNHLDLDMCHALEVALQGFDGALIMVSHDRHILRNTVDELLLVQDGRLTPFDDSLESYEQLLLRGLQQDTPAPAPRPEDNRKQQRQREAQQRQRLRPLKVALEKTEKAMATAEKTLAELEDQLADTELYTNAKKSELADILQRQGDVKTTLAELEEAWLEQQDALEEASKSSDATA